MLLSILALVASIVILASVVGIARIARQTARDNGIAAGLWFGGKHARQPRAYRAHRATRAERAARVRADG